VIKVLPSGPCGAVRRTDGGNGLSVRATDAHAQGLPDSLTLPRGGDTRGRASPRWFGAARSTRTRILASYVVLLAFSVILGLVALREVLLIGLNDRIEEDLTQEVAELRLLLNDGRDPQTSLPFDSLPRLFEVFLFRNVPGSGEGLLTFVEGEQFAADVEQYPLDEFPAERIAEWEELAAPSGGISDVVTGTFDTELGTAHYNAARVRLGDDVGAFVVAILPADELEVIADLQTYGAVAALGVLLLGSAAAWLLAGRVLAPVQQLTDAARSISQSDLSGRISVHGGDDAAEMARSFNGMLDRIEAVMRSQREFVQDASHELRDPLTICSGHLELLSDDPQERRETIALVVDELDRMARIVDDLQLLADADQRDFLRPATLQMEPFTRELAAKAAALAPRNWIVDSAADVTIQADRYRLTEAVMNLAHNAVQHTADHHTIAIGSSATEDEVSLWVRDTGFGIAVSEQPRVFDRFRRGRSAHRRYRGSGLGLAIVRTIVEAHGGRVELASRLGEGSTFTMILPLGQPATGTT
jgi:two-component system OmpR family sensor kinase